MTETTLQARLGVPTGANTSPKKNWKSKKPYVADHHQQAIWPRSSSHGSYEPEEGRRSSSHGSPSIFDRLGPKVNPALSLLERMGLQGNEATEAVAGAPDPELIPLDAVPSATDTWEEDGEIPVNHSSSSPARREFSEEDGEVTMPGIRSARFLTQTKRTPDHNNNSFVPAPKAPEPLAPNGPVDISMPIVQPDSGPAAGASSSRKRPPLPLQARIDRALRSAVFENAKLREKSGAIDANKLRKTIDVIVTENISESFGAHMEKVKMEMDATGKEPEDAMARAKHELLNGFGKKNGIGDNPDNTWLDRHNSHSLLASTSILPTPPPSESVSAENMDKPPPKAPRAMLVPPSLPSFKGKEKAIDSLEDGAGPRERRSSYTRATVRAEPMHRVSSANAPLRARSPHRRLSPSPPPSSASRRRFPNDELPRYRSPPPLRINTSPNDRRRPLRSHSRSPVRTNDSYSPPRSGRRPSPRMRSPLRAPSHTRSFNSRRPSFSRSPPPPSASYSNGFRPRSFRKSRSRSTARGVSPRGRTFSGPRPPYRSRSRSPFFNSRHPEKRPFVRSPSPIRGRRGTSILGRRSRSPLPRKRKLTHPSPPRLRSPFDRRPGSPSSPYDSNLSPHRRPPARNGISKDGQYSTPGPRNGRDYEDSPTQLSTTSGPQHPPSTPARDYGPPPPPPNPCNNVPGLWFAKVGAHAAKVLEGRFVVEPKFAATWGIGPPTSPSTPQENSELSVVLMCLPTYAVRALSESLAPTNPTAETMATAVAGLKTSWPENGMLFLDMNVEGSRGKTWLPYDIDPASPLDVTKYIQPGPNVIRFIQLTSMEDRTFILYASRREREPTRSLPDPVSDFFGNSAGGQSDNPLFDFSPTVTVSNS